MNILQKIFKNHYEEILYILHPRRAVIENVDKMINCGDPAYGGAMFGCTECGNMKFVPFRCHSRFCPTCGNMYSIDRTTSMSFKLINCSHRHCVFTIPEELRHFFLKDRNLLNCLFSAVNIVVHSMFKKINKTENFTPGFICVLHTFSRSVHWKPHIHCLISEGATGSITAWRKISHFNYNLLRNAFRTVLLNQMHNHIGDSFKQTKAFIYKNCQNGFYVHAKPNKCEPNTVAKYIGRYLGRPVIATSRIDNYDGKFVTFHYNRHEDNALVTEKLPALEFIKRLIQHIPEKYFKMIRYYGIYAKPLDKNKKLVKAISKEKHKFLLSLNKWRNSILLSFGYDVLKCPCCGETMTLLELYHKRKRIPLDEIYKKVMQEYKHHS